MKRICVNVLFAFVLTGCATYQYSKNVKLVAFEDNVAKGKSVGPIEGQDCVWSLFGYKLGGEPTLDRAFASARNQSGGGVTSAFTGSHAPASSDQAIRYINNVSTSRDGFNAYIVGKNCLVVKGTGYR
jgi:hypothetical protein